MLSRQQCCAALRDTIEFTDSLNKVFCIAFMAVRDYFSDIAEIDVNRYPTQ